MISTPTVVGLDTLSSRFAKDIMNRVHFDTKHRVIGCGHSKKTKIKIYSFVFIYNVIDFSFIDCFCIPFLPPVHNHPSIYLCVTYLIFISNRKQSTCVLHSPSSPSYFIILIFMSFFLSSLISLLFHSSSRLLHHFFCHMNSALRLIDVILFLHHHYY